MNPEGVLLTPTPVWRWLGFEDLALKSEEYDWPHSIVSSVFFCMIRKEKTLWKSYISGSSQPQCILLFCSCVTKFGWVASASSMSLCRDTGVTEMGFLVLVANLCEIYVCVTKSNGDFYLEDSPRRVVLFLLFSAFQEFPSCISLWTFATTAFASIHLVSVLMRMVVDIFELHFYADNLLILRFSRAKLKALSPLVSR